MSYIRSTSNPERLYVYGDGKDIVFHQGDIEGRKIPYKTFIKLIKNYLSYYKEYFDCDGFSFREILPKNDILKIIKLEQCKKTIKKAQRFRKENENAFKYCLKFPDGFEIIMWPVTCEYIVKSAHKDLPKPFLKKYGYL